MRNGSVFLVKNVASQETDNRHICDIISGKELHNGIKYVILDAKGKMVSALKDKNRQMAEKIAAAVRAAGGSVYYVGGLVRDELLGRENKDVDIEVHGVTPQTLEGILDSLGERLAMGASFGVYGLRHYELDIAMPRKENADGRGHRDFADFADPFIGTEKAAMRRDLTINALMKDVLTGQIVDHFGGVEDLRRGIIRHVNERTFAEDPLRVLRAAQFAARFGFQVAEETITLCSRLELSGIAGERILGELEKAMMKAPKPSVFFQTLREMNQLHTWFPEVEELIGIPQEPRFHPEGDVWNHTMLVLDQAAQLRKQAEYPFGLMMAALCHDFGKTEAMQDDNGRIRALGHEEAGVPIAERFLRRITKEVKLHRYVSNMVLLHMRPNIMASQNSGGKSFNRLFDKAVSPADLLLLAKADALGRAIEQDYSGTEAILQERLSYFREVMARPCVMGADLVALGYAPGPDFKEALDYAHKMRLAGVSKADALRQTEGFLKKQRRGQ